MSNQKIIIMKSLIVTFLVALFFIQMASSQEMVFGSTQFLENQPGSGSIYKLNGCEQTLFYDSEIHFPTIQGQNSRKKLPVYDEDEQDTVYCSLSGTAGTAPLSLYPYLVIDSTTVIIPVSGEYGNSTPKKLIAYILVINLEDYSIEKTLKVDSRLESDNFTRFINAFEFTKLPNNNYVLFYGKYDFQYATTFELNRHYLSEDLTTISTEGEELWPFSGNKIRTFGNRWSYRASTGIHAFQASPIPSIYNTITGQNIEIEVESLTYDHVMLADINKVDESTSIQLFKKNGGDENYYIVQYNYLNFEGQIIDSVLPNTEDYKRFGNGSAPRAFYYVGDNNFVVISNYGGTEMAGTVSLYNTTSKTTTVIKNFTNINEIPDSHDYYIGLTHGDKFITAKHIVNYINGEVDIDICENQYDLQRIKCFDCQDYWDYENSLDVLEEVPLSKIILYPNPVNNKLNITGVSNPSNIIITNPMGQIVYKENNIQEDNHVIDVNGLSNGVYFVNIQDNKGNEYNSKFIKE